MEQKKVSKSWNTYFTKRIHFLLRCPLSLRGKKNKTKPISRGFKQKSRVSRKTNPNRGTAIMKIRNEANRLLVVPAQGKIQFVKTNPNVNRQNRKKQSQKINNWRINQLIDLTKQTQKLSHPGISETG